MRNPSLEVSRQVMWPGGDPAPERAGLAMAATQMAGLDAGDVADELGADPLDDQLRLLLEEREQRRRSRGQDLSVELPAHLSTSQLVSLARDASAFALDLRRPMPQPPRVAGRRGTAFHARVEEHYADAGLVDVFDLPGSADESPGDEDLTVMQEHFLASEWADRVPLEVELSLEIVLGGHAVRGRVDAVFADDDGGVSVVDWKTGRPPRGAEARVRAVQLSAYRIAYARWRGIDPDRVRGAFFHAATGETLRPDLLSEDEVVALLGDVVPRRGRLTRLTPFARTERVMPTRPGRLDADPPRNRPRVHLHSQGAGGVGAGSPGAGGCRLAEDSSASSPPPVGAAAWVDADSRRNRPRVYLHPWGQGGGGSAAGRGREDVVALVAGERDDLCGLVVADQVRHRGGVGGG
ncbi:PD-(D/E)XK nuclease family protein [Janibacter limosus]|uniref:PD-(D/E)XK nuclease family protein n=1 Tax=Janibacter limosus TaxID=53458 RepID=A0AC61U6T1_9MICO|nr:PD-(D/E)XK nuclease family protein [Janibacter limosus]UUZ45537.1 PD-(D/E)XK nuclease family protein [Janibacter limosus]